MSNGDDWNKNTCPKLEVSRNSAPTLRCHDAESVNTWARGPLSHPNWQDVSIEVSEWTVLMEIMKTQRNGLSNDAATGANKGKQKHAR